MGAARAVGNDGPAAGSLDRAGDGLDHGRMSGDGTLRRDAVQQVDLEDHGLPGLNEAIKATDLVEGNGEGLLDSRGLVVRAANDGDGFGHAPSGPKDGRILTDANEDGKNHNRVHRINGVERYNSLIRHHPVAAFCPAPTGGCRRSWVA